jgi:hypothetical protein
MPKGCIVCRTPREVLAVINDQLKRKIPMRQIAADSGISKAAIGRHSLNCRQRQILQRRGSFGSDPADRWISVSTVDTHNRKAGVYLDPNGRETTPRPDDTIVKLRYQNPKPENPRTYSPEELASICNHQDDPRIRKILDAFPTSTKDPDTEPSKN